MRIRVFPKMQSWPRILVIGLCAAMVLGCPDKKHQNAQALGKPALELRKAVSFALATAELPTTIDALVTSLTDGLRAHVTLPPAAQPIVAEGDRYPSMKRLVVDLTDAKIDTGRKPPKISTRQGMKPGIRAQQFEFRAQPMRVDGGEINLNVSARDVELGVLHDREGHPVLSLSNAKDGTVSCQTTTRDLSRIFRASANERGKSFGLTVQKADLKLTSQNDRDVSADVRFASRLLLVPITLHFTAHVTVDRAGNARLSGLTCDGDDVAGTLITQFIRPALKEYNNKTMPLVGFPSKDIRLHDVTLHIEGESIRLAAAFGS